MSIEKFLAKFDYDGVYLVNDIKNVVKEMTLTIIPEKTASSLNSPIYKSLKHHKERVKGTTEASAIREVQDRFGVKRVEMEGRIAKLILEDVYGFAIGRGLSFSPTKPYRKKNKPKHKPKDKIVVKAPADAPISSISWRDASDESYSVELDDDDVSPIDLATGDLDIEDEERPAKKAKRPHISERSSAKEEPIIEEAAEEEPLKDETLNISPLGRVSNKRERPFFKPNRVEAVMDSILYSIRAIYETPIRLIFGSISAIFFILLSASSSLDREARRRAKASLRFALKPIVDGNLETVATVLVSMWLLNTDVSYDLLTLAGFTVISAASIRLLKGLVSGYSPYVGGGLFSSFSLGDRVTRYQKIIAEKGLGDVSVRSVEAFGAEVYSMFVSLGYRPGAELRSEIGPMLLFAEGRTFHTVFSVYSGKQISVDQLKEFVGIIAKTKAYGDVTIVTDKGFSDEAYDLADDKHIRLSTLKELTLMASM